MQYMMLIYENQSAREARANAPDAKVSPAYVAYTEAMVKAGILKGGNRLQAANAVTTVRITDGKTAVLDGPFVESKEQLGGYYVIEVPDLDAALAWAARCPGASLGAIEVRPIQAM